MFKVINKLPSFSRVKSQIRITPKQKRARLLRVEQLQGILSGKDERIIAIVGPCSADNPQAVLEFCRQLRDIEIKLKDKLFIIPRVFTAKPRSKSGEYGGLLFKPNGQQADIVQGIYAARKLFLDVLDLGFAAADELLYPENYRYFNDALGYITIGARSSENQQHKLAASGVEIPVGIKNPLNGNLDSLIYSVQTAQRANDLCFERAHMRTSGNAFAHAILRGIVLDNGKYQSNLNQCDELCALLVDASLQNPAFIADASHSNSQKDYQKQAENIISLIKKRKKDSIFSRYFKGFMLESYLKDGKQAEDGGVFGLSITDSCLGIEKTSELLKEVCSLI